MIDLVSHPPHYKTESGIEAIDVIEQYGLGYHLGNAMKYLLRAGRKDPAREREDLEKARWYLKRWLHLELPDGVQTPSPQLQPHEITLAFRVRGARRVAIVEILLTRDEPTSRGQRENVEIALAALNKILA